METEAASNHTQIMAAEAHDVKAIVQLCDADEFTPERFADEHHLAAPLDGALTPHGPHFVICIIPRVFKLAHKRPL